MAFCISGAKQYRQQRAAFLTGLCICRQHCAVNRINVGKIIRCLRLPQFAVRHRDPKSTEVYLHVSNKSLMGIQSPFDRKEGADYE